MARSRNAQANARSAGGFAYANKPVNSTVTATSNSVSEVATSAATAAIAA